MPQIFVAIATFVASAIGTAALAVGATTAFTTAAYFVAYYGTQMAIAYGISRALSPKMSSNGGADSLRNQALSINVRNPAAPRQIIYGQPPPVSGVLYPVGVSGTSNEYLHVLLLVAGHEVQELGDVYFNEDVVPLDGSGNATGTYAGYVRIKKHLGTSTQTVDTDLQTDLGSGYWTNSHRLRGIAYLYIRLKVSQSLFPGGIPAFRVSTKGRKVYDSRDAGQSATDPATWVWSANASLATQDWVRGVPMLNSSAVLVRDFGLGAPDADIDETASEEAANICDENVVLADASTEDRYCADGVILSSVRPGDGIEVLKGAMLGDVVWLGGKWIIRAGAYRTPTVTLDEGDLRAPLSGVRVKPSRKELFNVVKGIHLSDENDGQPADFPPVRNSTYKTQDGGEDLPADIELHFTKSPAAAQRIAKAIMERSRQGITFTARCKLTALQAQCTDVVEYSNARLGWTDKTFEVVNATLAVEPDKNGQPYIGVDLTLRETAAAVWDWANGEETTVDVAPNTTLPNPTTCAAPTSLVVLSDGTTTSIATDGSVVPSAKLTWTAPADANVTSGGRILIEYKRTADATYLEVASVEGDKTLAYIHTVLIGTSYDFRIRSVNGLGVLSSYITVTGTTVAGDTTAPSAPSGLTATAGTGKAVSLDWDDSTEADFSEYSVWRHTANVSGSATKIAEVRASRFVDVDVTLATPYYYWVKAIDRSENVSGFSSSATATPGTVTSGSVDSTAPSTPSAPTYVSETTYLAGDGTAFARITIDAPALPTGAVGLNILYKNSAGSSYIIASQVNAAGNVSVDDLTPGVSYVFAVQAFSFSGVLSTISTTYSRTAPNDSSAPNAPSGVAGSNTAADMARVAPFYAGAGGAKYAAGLLKWTLSTSKNIAYQEVQKDTGGTLYTLPAGATEFPYSGNMINAPAGDLWRVRAVSTMGVASAWGTASSNTVTFNYGTEDMAEQASNAVAVTGGTIAGVTATNLTLSSVSSQSGARTALGLGTVATQAANAVALTGGSTIGQSALGTGNFFANDASSGISGASTAVDVKGVNFRIYDSGGSQQARVDNTTGDLITQGGLVNARLGTERFEFNVNGANLEVYVNGTLFLTL